MLQQKANNEANLPKLYSSTYHFSYDYFQGPDITMFFTSMGANKWKPDPNQRSKRIESGSVGEEEYESLYAQYFPQIGSLNFLPKIF